MTYSEENVARRVTAMVVAGALTLALVGATATASSASWTDEEWDASAVGALDCATTGIVDARAWGRVLSGAVGGVSLDPVLATDGITVENLAPAIASTGTSEAAPVTDLGSDAWSAGLGLSVLSSLDLGAGAVVPLDAGTGSYTQYGRATSGGEATGASGAVTSAAGGLVSIDAPDAGTPRLGSLRLSDAMDSVLPGLGTPVSRLSDVDLDVGTVASIADLDGCSALWDPSSIDSRVNREYLVAALRLALTSDVVSSFGTSVDTTLGTLQTALNARLTATVDAAVVSSVASLLASALGGIAGVGVDPSAVTVTVSGAIDLAPVRALLASDITDGVVTVNLASGRVTADLAALLGDAYADSDGLNGRDPNTSVLQPTVIDALLDRLSVVLADFVTNTVQPAISQAVLGTAITVKVVSLLDATVTVVVPVTVPRVIQVSSVFSGTIGGFTGASGYSAPTVATTVQLVPGQSGALLTALNALVATVTGPIASAVTATVLPAIGSIVVTPILADLSATTTSTLATVVGTDAPALVDALEPVLDLLSQLVDITLNAQPDQPGSVGAPAADASGRYFVSALHVGVVSGATSLLSLWAASSSVGPQQKR